MKRLFALALTTAALAAPAGAKPADLAVQAMHNFSACVVDRGERGPVALLAMDHRVPDYRKAMTRLARGHDMCLLNNRIAFNGVLFAGGLAERLIEKALRPDAIPAAVAYDPARPDVVARDVTETVALCVARKAPAETAALFATDPTSQDEDKAMHALGPALIACVPAGQKMAVNRPGLRAVLALSAYRLIQNNRPDMFPVVGS